MTVPNKNTKFCQDKFACDGNPLTGARIDKGVCGVCDKAREKRAKVKPLRGYNTALPHLIKRTE